MSILGFMLLLVLIGLFLAAINKWIPMEANIKKILNVAVIVFVIIICVWFLLGLFNVSLSEIFGSAGRIRVR
jgi:hypothetical protein